MRKFKYEDSLATGSIACAGTLAILIPPSMAFILYGVVTGQSIGLLFMAGILPGVLLTAFFVGAIFITTILRPQAGPAGTKTSFKAKVISLKNVWHLVLLVLLILGGIYGGIFTPTEAGAIGAFGVIVIAAASRRLTLRIILDSFLETGRATAMVFLLIIGAYFFMRFIAVSQVTVVLSEVVSQTALPPLVIFGLIVLLYIILGMFLDIIGAILITIPVIYPLIIALGFDPIWFGVIAVMVIQMGLVTPPVGFEVYILSGVTNVPVSTIFRGVAPFCIAIIICIIILVIFPQIALFLPGTMMR
jgi:tripartite ATP-independent transporter DctM subunit